MSSTGPDSQRYVIVPNRPYWRGGAIVVAVLWPLSLLFTGYLLSRAEVVGGAASAGSDSPRLERTLIKELRQQIATLKRSDQISRNANIELQSTLAEREEEVSGLRADVDFYERLVGSTGQRQGLRVHEAVFAPEAGGTWHYTVTLTQNLNRGAISKGQMRLSIEGVRGGKLATVKWDELLQKTQAPGQPFSFRYFQQLEGSLMLPPGFTPQRVRVALAADGKTVDGAFAWTAKKP
jgi:hypothetical protein